VMHHLVASEGVTFLDWSRNPVGNGNPRSHACAERSQERTENAKALMEIDAMTRHEACLHEKQHKPRSGRYDGVLGDRVLICTSRLVDSKLSIRMVAGFAELAERKENRGCGSPIRTE
jgi:hypothetical protein